MDERSHCAGVAEVPNLQPVGEENGDRVQNCDAEKPGKAHALALHDEVRNAR
jgi:hypothetical protein